MLRLASFRLGKLLWFFAHLAALAAVAAVGVRQAAAQSPWYEGFEGPRPSWNDRGGNCRYRVESHRRVRDQSHTGQACEYIQLAGQGGTHVYFGHEVGRPLVIDELLPSVWVKSDRSGIQLIARVALPRSTDPRTGKPLTTLVYGSSYSSPGQWQQLRLENVPEGLTRSVRVVRSQMASPVDPREAYVEEVLLNVYGGPGVTNVWIDDLDVGGYVGRLPPRNDRFQADGRGWRASSGNPAAGRGPHRPEAGVGSTPREASEAAPRRVELLGSVLTADGHPLFVRAIGYRGESVKHLAELGFNAIWLGGPPSDEMLQEARRLKLWLVCPPPVSRPSPEEVRAGDAHRDESTPSIDARFEPVIAWDAGSGLTGADVAATRAWVRRIRRADRRATRPIVCRPRAELRAYSRYVDLLLIGRLPLATSLELNDYGTWLRGRPRLARPGTPIWTIVQTQPAESIRRQWDTAGRGLSLPPMLQSEQIRLLLHTAVASGSRGLLFDSSSPLDATDATTRHRAAALELLNLELELIEPWLSSGHLVTTVRASDPEVVGAVLAIDRARLLIPIWVGPGAQLVPGQSTGKRVSFVVPGVPESNNAYLLTPGRLSPLKHKRVTGGVQVTLEEFSLSSRVLLTQEPLVISSLTKRAARIARRAAELQRQLAAWKLHLVQEVDSQLLAAGAAAADQTGMLSASQQSLESCDRALASGDLAGAYANAQRAMRPLRAMQRRSWLAAVEALGSPVASPATVCFTTLPWHHRLIGRFSRSGPSENQVACGDLEDLQMMLRTGWQHFQHASETWETKAELSPVAARSGELGLRLVARAADDKAQAGLVETPPVWITTPPVSLAAGTWIRIHAQVQVPEPITGSVDGLMIVDSITGEAMAERIGETTAWQPVTMYRVVPESGPVTVSFALSGMGEAWIDNVSIQVLRPGVGSPPATPSTIGPGSTPAAQVRPGRPRGRL